MRECHPSDFYLLIKRIYRFIDEYDRLGWFTNDLIDSDSARRPAGRRIFQLIAGVKIDLSAIEQQRSFDFIDGLYANWITLFDMICREHHGHKTADKPNEGTNREINSTGDDHKCDTDANDSVKRTAAYDICLLYTSDAADE